jgi:hypothetical protein
MFLIFHHSLLLEASLPKSRVIIAETEPGCGYGLVPRIRILAFGSR